MQTVESLSSDVEHYNNFIAGFESIIRNETDMSLRNIYGIEGYAVSVLKTNGLKYDSIMGQENFIKDAFVKLYEFIKRMLNKIIGFFGFGSSSGGGGGSISSDGKVDPKKKKKEEELIKEADNLEEKIKNKDTNGAIQELEKIKQTVTGLSGYEEDFKRVDNILKKLSVTKQYVANKHDETLERSKGNLKPEQLKSKTDILMSIMGFEEATKKLIELQEEKEAGIEKIVQKVVNYSKETTKKITEFETKIVLQEKDKTLIPEVKKSLEHLAQIKKSNPIINDEVLKPIDNIIEWFTSEVTRGNERLGELCKKETLTEEETRERVLLSADMKGRGDVLNSLLELIKRVAKFHAINVEYAMKKVDTINALVIEEEKRLEEEKKKKQGEKKK